MAAAPRTPALPVSGIYGECVSVGTLRAAAHATFDAHATVTGRAAIPQKRNQDLQMCINGRITAKSSVKHGEKSDLIV